MLHQCLCGGAYLRGNFGQMGSYGMDAPHTMELYGVMAALTLLALFRHRANIRRFLRVLKIRFSWEKPGRKGKGEIYGKNQCIRSGKLGYCAFFTASQ